MKTFKPPRHVVTCLIALAAASSMMMAGPVQAANITWSTPTAIGAFNPPNGETIVDTSGTLVTATNYTTSTQSNKTVNGVTFMSTSTVASGWNATTFDFSIYQDGGITNTDFADLLDSFMFGDTQGAAETLTLTGLTENNMYLVQLFISDDRSGSAGRTQTVTGGTNTTASITQSSSVSLIGTFTADATTQSIVFTPGGSHTPILNAQQLRDVTVIPAPAALPAGLGLLAITALRRRRRA